MKTFKERVKSILMYHFCEKNFVLFIKRMIILIAVMLAIEVIFKYFNFPDSLKIIILTIILMFFSYIICSFLVYRLKEAKEAIKEIIVMIKNL